MSAITSPGARKVERCTPRTSGGSGDVSHENNPIRVQRIRVIPVSSPRGASLLGRPVGGQWSARRGGSRATAAAGRQARRRRRPRATGQGGPVDPTCARRAQSRRRARRCWRPAPGPRRPPRRPGVPMPPGRRGEGVRPAGSCRGVCRGRAEPSGSGSPRRVAPGAIPSSCVSLATDPGGSPRTGRAGHRGDPHPCTPVISPDLARSNPAAMPNRIRGHAWTRAGPRRH